MNDIWIMGVKYQEMSKMEVIDGKQTTWGGLWWHPESMCFTSQVIGLSELRKFKGHVRVIVKKNRFYNNGENNKPNYVFLLRDAKSDDPMKLEIEDMDLKKNPYIDEDGVYRTEDGERLYTEEDVQRAINRAVEDGHCGYYSDDVIVSDYLPTY